jgi:hypothetical protein
MLLTPKVKSQITDSVKHQSVAAGALRALHQSVAGT